MKPTCLFAQPPEPKASNGQGHEAVEFKPPGLLYPDYTASPTAFSGTEIGLARSQNIGLFLERNRVNFH